jgi:hypothetical protein
MIIKEYECMAHGFFEGCEPVCPEGCHGENMVQRVFLTAPSIQTSSYNGINRTLESLAQEHGLTDMNNRGGVGMRMADLQAHKRLNTAMDIISARSGENVSTYFGDMKKRFGSQVSDVARPIGDAVNPNADTRGMNGTIYRDQNTGSISVGEGINLNKPQARVESKFDGRSAGLPT